MKSTSFTMLFVAAMSAIVGCVSSEPQDEQETEFSDAIDHPAAEPAALIDNALMPEPVETDAPESLVRRVDEISPEACKQDGESNPENLKSSGTSDYVVGGSCGWCESSWTCVLSSGKVRYSGTYVLINNVWYCSGNRGSCC
jgi:hypothetical protein